jgi:predicted MFS family arabinose efflux permease
MRRVLPLTVGSMALGLDAYVVAGILPVVGAGLHTSASAVGQMVTVFTLSYGLLSPVCATLVTGRPVRKILLVALAIFTLGNILSAVAVSLPLLLVSRAIAGLGAGLYSPMSAAAAVGLVPPERRGRALAMITGGMSIGAAAGVPLGLTLAYHTGWRSTLWLVTALGLVAMAGIAAFVPSTAPAAVPPLRDRLAVLRDRRVGAVALIMMLISGTSIGLYTYVAPLLTSTLHVTHLAGYLWVWGLGGLAGSLLVGRLIDGRHDTQLVTVIMAVLGVTLLLFAVVRGPIGIVALLFMWGAAGWGTLAPQQHRMLALRQADGTVAVSLNASAMYLGSAIGVALGGLLLGSLTVTTLAVIFGTVALAGAALNLRTTPTPTPSLTTPIHS